MQRHSAECENEYGDDTLNGQGGQDLLAGNEGVDTLNDATAVIDEAFVLPASVLTALEVISNPVLCEKTSPQCKVPSDDCKVQNR